MPPKAPTTTPPTVITTLGISGDTSIGKGNLRVVTMEQLQLVVNQLIGNSRALKQRINKIGTSKIKMPFIKRYSGKKTKLKGFLIQIRLKIRNEGIKLLIIVDQVAYIGFFLTGRALKQFKLYLIEYKTNKLATANNEVKYIFLSQQGFIDRLT